MKSFLEIIYICTVISIIGCNAQKEMVSEKATEKKPLFRAASGLLITLNLGPVKMPVKMVISKNASGEYYGIIHNAEEKIETLPFKFKGDSIFIRTPMFNSEFKGIVQYDTYAKFVQKVSGKWRNYMKPGIYELPFTGEMTENLFASEKINFLADGATYFPAEINGKWEVTFSPGTKDEYKAIGIFKSEEMKVTGTFMTETGDYRYLEGIGNTIDPINLSCFDGSHAFHLEFSPNSKGDSLNGMFYSGKHWQEPWVAVRNEKFELTNPDSLTFIKKGYNGIAFSFPNLDGETVSFPSEKFENKVTIIQLMGSWCPNCVDETKVLSDFYNSFHEKGLEVVALCFETTEDFEKSKNDVTVHKDYFNAKYEFLIAGLANTKKAAEALPMLNHVMSFPTTVFIDKKGNVRKIYTGFYGPSTGSYYDRYIEQTTAFIEKLLSE